MTMGEKEYSELQLVGAAQFSELTAQAAAAPRKRSHLLLHAGPDDQVQRLIIAAQPGTYVRPHQHGSQWEMLVLQSGRMDIVTFDADATVLSRITLDRAAPIVQISLHGMAYQRCARAGHHRSGNQARTLCSQSICGVGTRGGRRTGGDHFCGGSQAPNPASGGGNNGLRTGWRAG